MSSPFLAEIPVDLRGLELEYLTEQLYDAMRDLVRTGKTVLLCSPPGTGKSQAAALLSTAAILQQIDLVDVLRIRTIITLLPTHESLHSFANRVVKVYADLIQRVPFLTTPPKVMILRGSVYSCVNPSARALFDKFISFVQNKILTSWGVKTVAELEEQVRRLIDQLPSLPGRRRRLVWTRLMEYARYSYLEASLSHICKTCPYNKLSAVMDTIRKVMTAREVMIVDSAVEIMGTERVEGLYTARKLVDELGVQGCPYRALLLLVIFEAMLSRELRISNYLVCATHAMFLNPVMVEYLRSQYERVKHIGRTMPHLFIKDEVDWPLACPVSPELPGIFNPEQPYYIARDEVARALSRHNFKLTSETATALLQLVRHAEEFFRQITPSIRAVWRGAPQFLGAAQVLKVFQEEFISRRTELLDLARKAAKLLSRWREKIAQEWAAGNFEALLDDLTVLVAVSKLVTFYKCVCELELERLSPVALQQRLHVPELTCDVESLFSTRRDPVLKLLLVSYPGISFDLYEYSYRFMLDTEFPYPFRGQIGMSATLSKIYFTRGFARLLVDYEFLERLCRKAIYVYYRVRYRNVTVYRASIWLRARTYEMLYRIGRGAVADPEVVEREIMEALTEVEAAGHRRAMLSQPSDKIAGLTMAADVVLNALAEIHWICEREFQDKSTVNVLLIAGTEPQFRAIAAAVVLLQRRPPVRHCDYTIEILRTARGRTRDVLLFTARVRKRVTKTYRIMLTYARSRFGRGVDLPEVDLGFVLSPPMPVPTTIYFFRFQGEIEALLPYMKKAADTVVQATFRIVRKLKPETKKVLVLERCLATPLYLQLYPEYYRDLVLAGRPTLVTQVLEG